MAIAWPYAAVYTDPSIAASLLQVAASALHYHPPPPMYTPHYPRYHPYPSYGVPPGGIPMTSVQHPASIPTSMPQPIPQPQLHSGLNLNLNLDFPHQMYHPQHPKVSPSSPVHSELSLSPPMDGLLIPASKVSPQTQLPDKPKLFKPYKSEV